ncbi:MAG TPA: ribosome maturation factor RimM [Vicinamibacterales bacterium]|jgi:16S rRNA processing protein RimM
MIWDEMAVVGRIARPHGIRGQVVVNPETDFPEERFRKGAAVFVDRNGAIAELSVAAVHFYRERPVIAFDGIGSVDEAERLVGLELRVPVEQLQALPEGTFYHHDLVGSRVETVAGELVGRVTAVDSASGGARLVVDGARSEVLIPLAAEICRTIDARAKRIVVELPAGLLELNERSR